MNKHQETTMFNLFGLFPAQPPNPRTGSFEREFHAPRFQEELQALRNQIDSRDQALRKIAAISRDPEVTKIAKRF